MSFINSDGITQMFEMDFEYLLNNQVCIQCIKNEKKSPVVKHELSNQLTIVLFGEGRLLLEKETYNIVKNDIIFIKKNELHSFVTEEELYLVHIYFNYEEIDESDRRIVGEFKI